MLQIALIAQTDGGLIQAAREPGFQAWAVYLLIAFLIYERVMRFMERRKARSVEVQQPLEVRQAREPADKAVLDKLVEGLPGLLRELEQRLMKKLDDEMEMEQGRHIERLRAGEHRVMDLTRVMEDFKTAVEGKIEHFVDEMREGRRVLHEKVNAVVTDAARHGAEIPHLKSSIATLTERINNDIPRLHTRIDDAMRAAAEAKKRT
jgi:gas vesicle protein